MLIQAQGAKRSHGVNGENGLRRLIREQCNGDGDQSTNEVRVAVAAVMEDCHSGVVDPQLLLQPDLAYTSPHFISFVVGNLAQGFEAVSQLDQIAISVLPVVEGAEIFANCFEGRHGVILLAAILKRAGANGRNGRRPPARSISLSLTLHRQRLIRARKLWPPLRLVPAAQRASAPRTSAAAFGIRKEEPFELAKRAADAGAGF